MRGLSNRFAALGFLGILIIRACWLMPTATGLGANWGTQSVHRLPPEIVVRLLRDNGIKKVKLFDADYDTLRALGKSGIEVMVGIPNDLLVPLASSMKTAEKWVSKNVSRHITSGVNIRYVAVGNEPFLKTYNGTYLASTFPALQNIQSALIKAGISSQVKVTVPLNADVYESPSGLPSNGDFRADIHDLVLPIVSFLSNNGGPFLVNIYPFISLYSTPDFPVDYAFFDTTTNPVVDGQTTYYNMFDANYDTLAWSLQKNGFQNLQILVGEIGWPTDGDLHANLNYAQRFNQGFISRIADGKGTALRSGPIEAYLFGLIDEDAKSIQPGNFERHWGVFYYDGSPKYGLNLGLSGNSQSLVPAKGVKYLERKWCTVKRSVNLADLRVGQSVGYACALADCTRLGYGTSCGNLDTAGNVSYAYNSYYQMHNQIDEACDFKGLATVTNRDPSIGTCRFEIMIQQYISGVVEPRRMVGMFPGLALYLLAVA